MSLLDKLIKQEKSRRVVHDVFSVDATPQVVRVGAHDASDILSQLEELEILLDANMANESFNRKGMIRELEMMLLRHI